MNSEKWDAFAEAFAAGTAIPANGWAAWNKQALDEAVTIRCALPESVECLVEVGCGVGRLTPYLAIGFPRVVCTDTSAACRAVTRERCCGHGNVIVMPPDHLLVEGDAALVWGNLYDEDWSDAEARAHLYQLVEAHRCVLVQHTTRSVITLRNDWALTTSDDWMMIERP